MSKYESRPQPLVTHSDTESDESDRGQVVKTKSKPLEFKRGAIVYIRASGGAARDGPYKIEKVLRESRKFTLCDVESSITVKDGREFTAEELER
ncbi:hypothetical protein C7999DRAFT_32525 [Corynascus novoguineensis]|uniref:Uncharacterized protein n=1 Tax=Corynascus novoguineensis TaxID=1126955 RepID=A0AAN7HIP0_9PEZI|nr:hypothetical protein C7999DRAFT_32525 [Corynascus novoguineensis]